MKKIILTAAIVFTVGILALVTTNNSNKMSSVKIAKAMVDDKNILATAD